MILQFGALFGDIAGGLFSSIGGFLKETVGGIVRGSGVLDIGQNLLKREVDRIVGRKARQQQKHQLRQSSNLAGQGPAVPGQTAVPTGGRVFQPPILISNVIPPGSGVGRQVSPQERAAQLATRRSSSPGIIKDFLNRGFTAAGLPRQFGAGGLGAPGGRTLGERMFGGTLFGGRVNGGILPIGPQRIFGGGRFPDPGVAMNGTGLMRRSVFQRTQDNCNVQHFVIDRTSGQLTPIEFVADHDGMARFRLDLTDQTFKKIKSRRMNPLNFKALGRARRRTGAALRVCRTMFTEARREKTGRVRPKRRAKRK